MVGPLFTEEEIALLEISDRVEDRGPGMNRHKRMNIALAMMNPETRLVFKEVHNRNGPITVGEISGATGMERRRVRDALRRLRASGRIEMIARGVYRSNQA